MKHAILISALALLSVNLVSAQKPLPLIKAKSLTVDIRDGKEMKKGYWTITPKVKPDIYTTSGKNSLVTFITDCDSITFRVKPDKDIDFIILVNGKDSALTRIKYQPTYLERLRKAARYNPEEKTEIPQFTYQTADDPKLKDLRNELKLDSIAGTGNEISRMINLLHWIHDLIPHDGNNGNPQVKNAMNMILVCKKDHRGLNCRGLATVLNECYLAEGFKSRFITCMPKDSVFNDCHVINMVWSHDLYKWIWIDPTNNAYVMNEKGELLSIEEVRERVINGKPLLLNPDANWNRKSSAVKEEYLYNYMAKNLYRMECPLSSEYDTETAVPGKKVSYVELLPLDAFNQFPKKSEHRYSNSGVIYTNYKTNNPTVFWARPE